MPISRTPLDVSRSNDYQKEEILKYAVEARKFEIERFWQRSLFFWGFIAAAFVAYAQSSGHGVLTFLIGCFGLVCSIAWTMQNRGSKYWYEAWEQKVESVEQEVLGVHLFRNREPVRDKGRWGAYPFSVTKLAIALSDFTALTWLALVVRAFLRELMRCVPAFPAFAGVVTMVRIVLTVACAELTIVYIAFLFIECGPSEPNNDGEPKNS